MTKEYIHKDALRAKRLGTGLSLRQLANTLGVSFSVLARIEGGNGHPSPHVALILERYLFPKRKHAACLCVRCRPVLPENTRLLALESRIETLERGVASLQVSRERALKVTRMHEKVNDHETNALREAFAILLPKTDKETPL